MTVLRDGLLEGRAVALGGAVGGAVGGGALGDALGRLGARVELMPALDGAVEEQVGEWARSRLPLGALVYVEGGSDEFLESAWAAVREVAVGALIPGGEGGKIVLVAPAGAGVVAAALENLARTLSVEWARFGVTAVAVAPGPGVGERELEEVVCYLVSVAGDYFSGCRFDLGATGVAAPDG